MDGDILIPFTVGTWSESKEVFDIGQTRNHTINIFLRTVNNIPYLICKQGQQFWPVGVVKTYAGATEGLPPALISHNAPNCETYHIIITCDIHSSLARD